MSKLNGLLKQCEAECWAVDYRREKFDNEPDFVANGHRDLGAFAETAVPKLVKIVQRQRRLIGLLRSMMRADVEVTQAECEYESAEREIDAIIDNGKDE